MSKRQTIAIAAILGMLVVILGAFGAHALKGFLEANGRLETYKTAVEYQFYHVLATLFIGLSSSTDKKLSLATYSFLLGIVFFSGSLYLLCFTGITSFGAITPIGGVLFIVGWLLTALHFFKKKV